jgi:hypothetical protein
MIRSKQITNDFAFNGVLEGGRRYLAPEKSGLRQVRDNIPTTSFSVR